MINYEQLIAQQRFLGNDGVADAMQQLLTERDELLRQTLNVEVEQTDDAKEAARYRFLKQSEAFVIDEQDSTGCWEPVGDLDAAIDAAMKGKPNDPL